MHHTHVIDEETPLLDSTLLKRKEPTPLPKLQIAIILFLQLCEPITSHSIYPYINQLVSELDITGGDERKVGYYAGLIESLFFATEAITVLQWSRISDYIGRKPVLLTGLLGLTLSMTLFGLSRTFWTLVISRCLCGLLNGNIGVMKSVMGELTDSTNRAQGFAFMPVVWGAGSTIGPLIGGLLARPHDRFPEYFTGAFWQKYPYFLPCIVTSGSVFIAFGITALFFKETVPKRSKRPQPVRSPSESSDRTVVGSRKSHKFDELDGPLPLRKLLTYPVVTSVSNYVAIAFLDISLRALLPLFFAMPMEIGGLGLSPQMIGYTLGSYGAFSGIFQAFMFAKIIQRFGERAVFIGGVVSFIPIFCLFPVMSLIATRWGVNTFVWISVACVLLLMVIMDMAYGCIFMYITASAPNRRSLGATNGLSQTSVSIARAIGPAMATSLFSFSVEKNILSGYGVYAALTVFTFFALALAVRLPREMWEESE